jgi:CubicO group peptidase (beta-lactamase class C family)
MVSFIRLITAALLVAGTARAQIATPHERAVFVTRVDSLVHAYMAESHAPGVSVAVVRGRDTLVMAGFGLADIAAHRPATPATIYEIGSNTKQFTSAAVMRLAEQHKLSIDDELSRYLPQIPLHGNRVTIRQLLTHTSGIHSYTDVEAWKAHWAEDLTPDSIMGFVAKDSFDFAPGTRYKYDNSGYILLGMVIEKVSGQPYATYLKSEFFEPLGLTHTSYCPSHPTDPAFATGYSKKGDGVVPHEYLSLTQPYAAGSLCSTVGDFVQWQRDLAGGKVVSPESFTLMTTAATLNNGEPIRYGFGLVPGDMLGHKDFGHSGGIPGYTTMAYYFPADTLNVVVFSNYDAASPAFLAGNIARIAYGGAPEAPRPLPQPVRP